jgi:sarcosine oxidase gamma subunit
VIEYSVLQMSVVVCCGEPAALDNVAHGALHACRVAPDELMLLDRPAAHLYGRALSALQVFDSSALVLDVSAGWSAWQLSGDAAHDAFARLSAIPLANGFSQGAVAGVPARVLVAGSTDVIILTASTLRNHIGRRVRESCADLHAVERPARELGEGAPA